MKKLVFKKWVENLLMFITFITMFIMILEHTSFKVMLLKGLICAFILIVNINLLTKYGRSDEDE